MYPGGKDGAGVVHRLVNQIPPHDVFVSAFLGDCAVLRRKRPAARSVGIDLDAAVLRRWIERPNQVPGLELYHCDGIEWLRHQFGWYLVARSRVAVLGGCSRSGAPAAGDAGSRGARETHESATDDRQTPIPATVAHAAASRGQVLDAGNSDCARAAHHRPQNLATPAEDAAFGDGCRQAARVATCGDWARWFVYADPPYLQTTRRSGGRLYRCELTEADHVRLLDTLTKLPCTVMVSHYPCGLYAERLASWRTFTFESQTRQGHATEQVWCNYPPPTKLHDSRFLGRDKREREKLHRRARSAVGKLLRMPPLERQLVLDAVAAVSCRD